MIHYFHSPYTGELISIELLQKGKAGIDNWKTKRNHTGIRGYPKGRPRKRK